MHALLGALLLAVNLLGAAASAADEHPGRADYLRYCAPCHGVDGRGDGPAAASLTPRPADLTRLAAAHGGTFPMHRVMESIDGRNPITAHGRPAMPVWGEVFSAEGASTAAAPRAARSKIQLIASYLATLQ